MDLILLGGMNPETEAWAQKIGTLVEDQFDNTTVFRYAHWRTPGQDMDVDREVTALGAYTGGLDTYAVFAKSAGTWVTLKAIQDGQLSPQKCVFVGTAVNFARDNDLPIDDWLEGYSVPTLFVQKTADPAIGFSQLETLLDQQRVTYAQLAEVPGDDHAYQDVAELARLTTDFLA